MTTARSVDRGFYTPVSATGWIMLIALLYAIAVVAAHTADSPFAFFGVVVASATYAVVVGPLLWLLLTVDGTYRLMRNALGISDGLAMVTVALFPAVPRLATESLRTDTHVLPGKRGHGVVDPYAAVPSFHVGWVALSRYALWRSLREMVGRFFLVAPALAMTVIVTGNHRWEDGVI